MSELAETAELVVSEIVTNAVMAATDPEARLGNARSWNGAAVVQLRLSSDTRSVVIEVWDTNPQPPIAKQVELDDESGRGLMLVEALCTRWGWTVPNGWYGKVVWAELRAE